MPDAAAVQGGGLQTYVEASCACRSRLPLRGNGTTVMALRQLLRRATAAGIEPARHLSARDVLFTLRCTRCGHIVPITLGAAGMLEEEAELDSTG